MSKWQRFRFLPLQPLGEDGRIVTGSKEHIALSRRAAAEGMVLLKNDENVLPLTQKNRVALFGKAGADYVKGGGGSGDVTVAYVRNLCDGMEVKKAEGKVQIFEPLYEFYRENVRRQRSEGKNPGYTVEPEIPTHLLKEAAVVCDTAIISICRFSSEAWDRKGEPGDGDFYLSREEEKMVADVTAAFERIVVVLNVGGVVDTTWFAHNEKIKAVLMAWQGGMEGGLAQADILCGDICPSGKLVDTFAGSFADYPSSENFNESKDYVCYTDDIFVGYRYFETIPGAAEKVNYPFGYGLSYTTFAWKCIQTQVTKEQIHVMVSVTNTGKVAGKEIIQLYTTAPKCRLEMAHIELRNFAKTGLLQPGETQTLEMTVDTDQLAAYDEEKAAWVIPAGIYEVRVGTDIRSTARVCTYEETQERVVLQTVNRCVPRKLPCRMKADGTYEQLAMSEYEPKYDTTGWPNRIGWKPEHILPDQSDIWASDEERVKLDRVLEGKVTLDDVVNGLTDDELVVLVGGCANRGVADTRGIGGLHYLDITPVMTADGPAGLRVNADRGVKTTAWPVATALACSWDADLVYEVGVAGAREVLENNIGMWLTPAINIHRSPLCGRNFEYYSEDPLVSGVLASAMVRGIQSQKVSACVKHFCCNNKETNRSWSDSRVSERALREIYLKGFEIVVKNSDVWAVMTSYNLLNGTYTSENKELLMGILRGEWGYDGLIVTDWNNAAEPYREYLAGNNVRMPYGSHRRLKKAMELGLISREDLIPNVRKMLEWLLKVE